MIRRPFPPPHTLPKPWMSDDKPGPGLSFTRSERPAGAIDPGTVDGRSLRGNDQSLISAHSTALRPLAHRYRRGSCGSCQSNINVASGIRTCWRAAPQQDQARESFILGAILRGWRYRFSASHLFTRMLGESSSDSSFGLGLCFRCELGAIIFREHPAATQQFR